MVTKRQIVTTLVLGALAFVGVFHAVAGVVFGTGLELIGLVFAAGCLFLLVLLNIPEDEPDDEDDSAAGEPSDPTAEEVTD